MKRSGVYEAVDTSNLTPLGRLGSSQVASDTPDVRGWDVLANDGKKIGTVEEQLVDGGTREVRYLAVSRDRGLFASLAGRSGHVLIPVEDVRLDRDGKVYLDSLGTADAESLPDYELQSLGRSAAGSESYADTGRSDRLDDQREARVTVSEEELRVG